MLDRQSVIAKIKAMMAVRDGTDFDGEAQAAAALIDKMCHQYGITGRDLDSAQSVAVLQEVFINGRTRAYDKLLLLHVARFYDANVFTRGASLWVVGTEAQQIQTRVYFDFIKSSMEAEAQRAYQAEKVLCAMANKAQPGRDFLHTFKVAFTSKVGERLAEMKREEERTHEDASACALYFAQHFGTLRTRNVGSMRRNAGIEAGRASGAEVSLRRQLN